MKICILSGGSGNTEIVKALYSLGFTSNNIRIITNAYDNGKSTGVCRAVTDTLGVSDIRKNHFKIFSNELEYRPVENSAGLIRFYKDRIDCASSQDIRQFLSSCNLDSMMSDVDYFFSLPKSSKFEYRDFSISNIVYSSMYKRLGYEKTNAFFCNILGIDPNCVLLNSFDNAYLTARTHSGHLINDEGDIVEWKNANDKICSIGLEYINKSLNPKAIEELLICDIIIISSGTFWSSIYPTLEYADLYKFVNMSRAKKVWFLNTEYDNDSYNVSSKEFIDITKSLGLATNQFAIIQNKDSTKNNLKSAQGSNIITYNLGNRAGSFDSRLVADFLDTYDFIR